MTKQCNLPHPKNVFQNFQDSYMVYPSPSRQLPPIPLLIHHRQWVTKPMNWFSMVCCDIYLLWFVLVNTKWPALRHLAIWPSINVVWTLKIILFIISWHYQNSYPHTHMTFECYIVWTKLYFSAYIPYILESNPHLNLICTSFCRFLKRKKS